MRGCQPSIWLLSCEGRWCVQRDSSVEEVWTRQKETEGAGQFATGKGRCSRRAAARAPSDFFAIPAAAGSGADSTAVHSRAAGGFLQYPTQHQSAASRRHSIVRDASLLNRTAAARAKEEQRQQLLSQKGGSEGCEAEATCFLPSQQ